MMKRHDNKSRKPQEADDEQRKNNQAGKRGRNNGKNGKHVDHEVKPSIFRVQSLE